MLIFRWEQWSCALRLLFIHLFIKARSLVKLGYISGTIEVPLVQDAIWKVILQHCVLQPSLMSCSLHYTLIYTRSAITAKGTLHAILFDLTMCIHIKEMSYFLLIPKLSKAVAGFQKLWDRPTLGKKAFESCSKSFRKLCGKLIESDLNSDSVWVLILVEFCFLFWPEFLGI